MIERGSADLSRRGVLLAAAGTLLASPAAHASDEDVALIERLTGKTPALSSRVRLKMPTVFPNGYTVPLSLDIESPMTDPDHVRNLRVFAPKNPLVEVVTCQFAPGRSVASVSTRVSLAEPHFVVAVAVLNDGSLLMTKTWVDVATNGFQ